MTIQAVDIKESFLKLTKEEQLELMHFFLQVFAGRSSVSESEVFTMPEPWKKELDKRDEDYHSGKAKTIPLKEAMAEFGL
jgi:putative addiction module component (TIGR02574 family)